VVWGSTGSGTQFSGLACIGPECDVHWSPDIK